MAKWYTYLHIFRWLFYPCSKKQKNWAKKHFLWFLKHMIFSQKSDILNRFLVKFPFWKCILYILYFISFQVMSKTIFTKSYNFARVAPSLMYQPVLKGYLHSIQYVSWSNAVGFKLILLFKGLFCFVLFFWLSHSLYKWWIMQEVHSKLTRQNWSIWLISGHIKIGTVLQTQSLVIG